MWIPIAARRIAAAVAAVLESPATRTADLGGHLGTRQFTQALAATLAVGAPYICQGFSSEMKALGAMIAEGIRYPGFGMINALSPCVTFRGNDE